MCEPKIFAGVNGGLGLHIPGGEDPHRHQKKILEAGGPTLYVVTPNLWPYRYITKRLF